MSTWPPRRPPPDPWWHAYIAPVGLTLLVVVALLAAAGWPQL